MKNLTVITLLFLSINIFSQDTTNSNQEKAFDFWVGNWNLEWTGKDNKIIKGHNNIIKILDSTVIQENFEDPSTGFKGTSISVYNKKKNEWHQAWADNQGGYYNFIGEIDGAKRIFKTIPKKINDKIIIQRMVFYNITPTAFVWDWESSSDNGVNWKLLWQIKYKKLN
jgi:hypothetical protein